MESHFVILFSFLPDICWIIEWIRPVFVFLKLVHLLGTCVEWICTRMIDKNKYPSFQHLKNRQLNEFVNLSFQFLSDIHQLIDLHCQALFYHYLVTATTMTTATMTAKTTLTTTMTTTTKFPLPKTVATTTATTTAMAMLTKLEDWTQNWAPSKTEKALFSKRALLHWNADSKN